MSRAGILDFQISATPISVLDFETTGLHPGGDRVVEVSVVRIEPGKEPKVALNTMINPCRQMAATDIHGLTDKDVVDAPEFVDIVGNFVDSIAGSVVASYNIYFDIKFLEYELTQTGFKSVPPHLCLMYLRPMLNLGQRCSLPDACQEHDVVYSCAHTARTDAESAARLMLLYSQIMNERGIRTFGELAELKSYKFINSFEWRPFDFLGAAAGRQGALKPRTAKIPTPESVPGAPLQPAVVEDEQLRRATCSYWDALKVVLSDLRVTNEEIRYLEKKKQELNLSKEQIRMLHARAFMSALSRFTEDQWLDDDECRILRKLYACLSHVGWAPGQ